MGMPISRGVEGYFKKEHLGRPLIKYCYYPIAIALCKMYTSFGISAHVVNLLGLLASVSAAFLIFISTGWQLIVPGLLIIFAYVSDLCDGTMARYYNKKNAMGKWLDESAGFIGVSLIFFSLMMRTFLQNNDVWIIAFGFLAIFGYLMMNLAAILSETIRSRFNLQNPVERTRKKMGSFLGINPNLFAFSFDVQWTLIALGVIFNLPYVLFIVFGIFANLQWVARYAIFYGK